MSDFNIQTEIELLKRETKQARRTSERILKILEGNGNPKEGLVTKVELNDQYARQSVKRIWWFLTWIPTSLLGLAGVVVGILKYLI